MRSVLFVCTANMCRSPLAQGLLLLKIKSLQAKNWRVESAGTWASDGLPASQKSLLILLERGLDLSHHRSRSVTQAILNEFNLILTMEAGQKEALLVEFKNGDSKVYQLSEMIGQDYEIDDPIGGELNDYRETAREIENILDKGFDRIQSLASGKSDGPTGIR